LTIQGQEYSLWSAAGSIIGGIPPASPITDFTGFHDVVIFAGYHSCHEPHKPEAL
jgi:hypothetical protein